MSQIHHLTPPRLFVKCVNVYPNINNKKRRKTSFILTCVCKAVFDRWCVKLMMRNARARNMPFSFFPFFFFLCIEWPCLIDWSPESTIDRHTQSSTQTDDRDGRKKKTKKCMKEKKERGKYHGESNHWADCSLSFYLYILYSIDH